MLPLQLRSLVSSELMAEREVFLPLLETHLLVILLGFLLDVFHKLVDLIHVIVILSFQFGFVKVLVTPLLMPISCLWPLGFLLPWHILTTTDSRFGKS